MGGIIIKDKMTVIDGSVKQFYDSLKQELKMTKAGKKSAKSKPANKKKTKKKAVKKKTVKKKEPKKKKK